MTAFCFTVFAMMFLMFGVFIGFSLKDYFFE